MRMMVVWSWPVAWLLLICRRENYDRLCAKYGFEKPNDRRALELMNAAAKNTMEGIPEVGIGYGVSDEFRYLSPLFFFFFFSHLGGREKREKRSARKGLFLSNPS